MDETKEQYRKAYELAQDPKKQKEAEDKMNAFWVTLKKKYPNADMVKVKGFMDGVY
ncbi:MAG: hypothetical protein WCI04_00205 [archaeon]